jgi:hypothetical protein
MPNPSPFKKGCGCLLMVTGAFLILTAFFLVMGTNLADKKAGEKNEAEWAAYHQQVEAMDSIADVALRDSLIQELPHPIIRQGGIATMFALFGGFVIVVIALIPLGIGTYLYAKNRKIKNKI